MSKNHRKNKKHVPKDDCQRKPLHQDNESLEQSKAYLGELTLIDKLLVKELRKYFK